MNNLDKQYQSLLQDILDNGIEKKDRTGTGTISVFGRQIRHKMSEGFPLLTTKKMAWKTMVTELLWFLKGDTNIKYLLQNDCNIWTGDAYKRYAWKTSMDVDGQLTKEEFINKIKTDDEFAKKWGELGPIYGKQWREWKTEVAIPTTLKIDDGDDIEPLYVKGTQYIDQIQNLINDLKTNPDSRRLMVSAWNPADLPNQVLPPCHYGFQVYTRELNQRERCEIAQIDIDFSDRIKNYLDEQNIPIRAISLMYNARSQDVPLGTPFNIASYALLLTIIGKMVNMVPDELITNMGDCHIYKNQIDGVKEQLTREPYPLPKLVISNQVNFNKGIDEFLNSCSIMNFKIEGYQSHPSIKMPLSN